MAIVPDRHGTGTNALLLAPPDAIAPAFGPGSCARHADRARRAGHEVAVEPLDSLGLDVDTPTTSPSSPRRWSESPTEPPRRRPSWRDWAG